MKEDEYLIEDEEEMMGGVVVETGYRIIPMVEDIDGGMALHFGIVKEIDGQLKKEDFEIKIRGCDCFCFDKGEIFNLMGENITKIAKGVYKEDTDRVVFIISYTTDLKKMNVEEKNFYIEVVEKDKVDGVPFKTVIRKLNNKPFN